MTVINFSVDGETYAVDCREIVEIVPWVHLKRLPSAPGCVAGIMNYRGRTVPVVDLTVLLAQRSSIRNYSSRIILTYYPDHRAERREILGVLTENVCEIAGINESLLTAPGIRVEAAPFLDQIYPENAAINQIIKVSELLPDSLKRTLFSGNGEPVSSGATATAAKEE